MIWKIPQPQCSIRPYKSKRYHVSKEFLYAPKGYLVSFLNILSFCCHYWFLMFSCFRLSFTSQVGSWPWQHERPLQSQFSSEWSNCRVKIVPISPIHDSTPFKMVAIITQVALIVMLSLVILRIILKLMQCWKRCSPPQNTPIVSFLSFCRILHV